MQMRDAGLTVLRMQMQLYKIFRAAVFGSVGWVELPGVGMQYHMGGVFSGAV